MDLVDRLEDYAKDWRLRAGSKDVVEAALVEIKRLRPYVDAFRREETRADKAGAEIDRLRERIAYLESVLAIHHVSIT